MPIFWRHNQILIKCYNIPSSSTIYTVSVDLVSMIAATFSFREVRIIVKVSETSAMSSFKIGILSHNVLPRRFPGRKMIRDDAAS